MEMDAFLSFSINSLNDVDALCKISELLRKSNLKFWPSYYQNESYKKKTHDLMKAVEEETAFTVSTNKKFKDNQKLKLWKNFMELNFIGCIDEILKLIEAGGEEYRITKVVNSLQPCHDIETAKSMFEKEVKTVIFILTEKFYKSKVFKEQWTRAKRLKKLCYIILIENFDVDATVCDKKILFRLYKHAKSDYLGHEYVRMIDSLSEFLKLNLTFLQYAREYNLATAYFSYPTEWSKQIDAFNDTLEKGNLTVLSKKDMCYVDIEDCLDCIRNSKITVFFVDNKFLQSKNFMIEYEHAKKLDKTVFFVILEPVYKTSLINVGEFRVLEFENGIERLCKWILRVVGRDGCFELLDGKPSIGSVMKNDLNKGFPIKGFHLDSTRSFNNVLTIIDYKVKNKLIIVCSKQLVLLDTDMMTTEIINENYEDYEYTNSLCWIQNLSMFCGIINKDDKNSLALFSEDFSACEVRDLPDSCSIGHLSMIYSPINRKTYVFVTNTKSIQIFNEKFQHESLVPLKYQYMVFSVYIHDDKFYTPDAFRHVIHVYDLNLNYITSFGYSTLTSNITLHFDNLNNTNYIFTKSNTDLHAFNLSNYKYVGKIGIDSIDHYSRFSNKLFIKAKKKSTELEFYKIEYKIFKNRLLKHDGIHNVIDLKFICKLNTLKHLLKEAHVLPCGNLACIECIYDNYNIFTNTFKCNFETCQAEHYLTKDDVKKRDFIIEDNIKQVCEQLLDYESGLICDLESIMNIFITRIDEIENDIETRVESLKIEFDNLNENVNETIDGVLNEIKKKKKKGRENKYRFFDAQNYASIEIHKIGKLKDL